MHDARTTLDTVTRHYPETSDTAPRPSPTRGAVPAILATLRGKMTDLDERVEALEGRLVGALRGAECSPPAATKSHAGEHDRVRSPVANELLDLLDRVERIGGRLADVLDRIDL